jgi:hypothetical protein
MPARPFVQASHIEGHIAFLKAELKIAPAQEALFEKVAAAMREDVADFRKMREQPAAAPRTAVDALEQRARLADLRGKAENRFLAAFRPLYDSLSPDQKQTADGLMASGPGMGGMGGRMMGHGAP